MLRFARMQIQSRTSHSKKNRAHSGGRSEKAKKGPAQQAEAGATSQAPSAPTRGPKLRAENWFKIGARARVHRQLVDAPARSTLRPDSGPQNRGHFQVQKDRLSAQVPLVSTPEKQKQKQPHVTQTLPSLLSSQ